MSDTSELDAEVLSETIEVIRAGIADYDDICDFALAALSNDEVTAPSEVLDAIMAHQSILPDYLNGGIDQVVWNHGAESARWYASALDRVGAVECAELLERLADEVDRFNSDGDTVQAFLDFRHEVGGPFFGMPRPLDEIPEAITEWALEHPDQFVVAARDA